MDGLVVHSLNSLQTLLQYRNRLYSRVIRAHHVRDTFADTWPGRYIFKAWTTWNEMDEQSWISWWGRGLTSKDRGRDTSGKS